MYHIERRAILSLASIFAFRLLGLFMVLPVLSLYANQLLHHTPSLVGLAIGVYGLTQALLQIPFGMLSDKYGRKPIITMGLLLFAFGSVIAAMSTSIYGVIAGRALQGAGAIGSSLIAMVADVSSEEQRTKAMALIGMVIGISFSAAMILGPLLSSYVGVPGLFWLTALLALLGIVILYGQVPTPPALSRADSQTVPKRLRSVLSNGELLRFDIGIFCQHAILTAIFVVVPITMASYLSINLHRQWLVYLPVLLLSFATMLPIIIIAEKKRHMKATFLFAISLLLIALIGLWLAHHKLWIFVFCLYLFFTGFNVLEATLPSLVSKVAPLANKGTAMGVYSTAQFFGIFCGGAFGGWLFGQHHVAGVYYSAAALALGWLLLAVSMKQPPYLSTRIVDLQANNLDHIDQLISDIERIPGIYEVLYSEEEQAAYLKFDRKLLNEEKLSKVLHRSTSDKEE